MRHDQPFDQETQATATFHIWVDINGPAAPIALCHSFNEMGFV